ncbi:MAG: fumarylacetoacetate hydrolase family protein [Candidatus Bathyarchaeia archaeon]
MSPHKSFRGCVLLRLQVSTKHTIFTIAKIIEALSAGLSLEPGDIVSTGTPSGVGISMKPRLS